MQFLDAVLSNRTLLIPITAALGVQFFKFIWEAYRQRQFSIRVLLGTGGMPSSHAAMVQHRDFALLCFGLQRLHHIAGG